MIEIRDTDASHDALTKFLNQSPSPLLSIRITPSIMLSAIAARKAAQAAREGASGPIAEVKTPPSPPTSSIIPPATSKPNSKRKSTAQTPNSKRKKKEKRVVQKNVRYFDEPDAFAGQGDVIIIDSEEEPMYGNLTDPGPSTSQRRWSPSIPLNDSSEEEGGEAIPDIHEPAQPAMHTPHVLSNLHPIPNENMFFLTSDEVRAFNLSSSTPNLPATIVVLGLKETICLLGTYTFCVLQGSLSCSGVVLSASPRTHRVFAPRSSPLPILEGTLGNSSISDLYSKLPPRLHSLTQTPASLILIQELTTGVEGLGRICRTFDGVFEPSRWQKDDTLGSLQLPGVHMVSTFTSDSYPKSKRISIDHRADQRHPGLFPTDVMGSGTSTTSFRVDRGFYWRASGKRAQKVWQKYFRQDACEFSFDSVRIYAQLSLYSLTFSTDTSVSHSSSVTWANPNSPRGVW